MTGPTEHPHAALDAVVRIELPRLIGALARMTGDVGTAEELAQEATVAALEQWPRDGVPRNPGAWLTTTAKRRAVDLFRRNDSLRDKYAQLAHELDRERPGGAVSTDFDAALDDRIDDDLLRLIFTSCHPVLAPEGRAALTLRVVGGLSVAEIARAYLVPEPTMAARITRAKKALTKAGVPFEVPEGPDRAARLSSVLQVIYLVFNEGYSATFGSDWLRTDLTLEAVRLARVLAGLMPDEPEVFGLAALLEIQASRNAARVGPDGTPVLLLDQDRTRWDPLLIRRGLSALARAEQLGGAGGHYALQAAVAACHARAARPEDTDWQRIAMLYQAISSRWPSPVVEINRAVAVSFADGPAAALEILDRLPDSPALRSYHLLPSVRGDLLSKLGRTADARAEFQRAAALSRNEQERALLLARADGLT
ncbi:RNA polymerase sigma factor [Nakamurella alba]|uniref:RNA polymerase sigma factor n=1 Tax=Nakamurella alba TaxID=2665158 RepID=UPI002AC35145|nr:RNA polymerase sigma factor [Nakamurella alba]